MGEVYRAKDTRLGRDVAIKVLPGSFASDPDRRERFEREAQAVATLSHPNVVAIFDTGLHESSPGAADAQLFIVMELLAGQTLRERLNGGPVPVRKAVDIAVQIARGLGAAHTKHLVHRDLKPENVFLLDDGQVKVLDFGLARQSARSEDSGATATAAMTDAGTVLGTVGYMAPEQVRGQTVDARADVFAFGAVLYEMVTGQRAFQRDTAADTTTAILTQDPPELTGSRPDLSPALDRIIRHCLEKNANERFQNARDVAFALEALSGSTVSGTGTAAAVGRAGPSRGTLVMAAAVAAALILAGVAGYVGGRSAATSAGIADVSYQPVSFEKGFVFAARFAPDGRTIAYSADWDDQPRDVFVTSLDTRDYRPLGFRGADLLGMSRTGELAILTGSKFTLGSVYFRLGTLSTASMVGGTPRPEVEDVRFADVGPDKTMAIVRDDGRRVTMEYPIGQVLLEAPSENALAPFVTPRVSPTGEYVAFFDLRAQTAIRIRIYDRAGKSVAESQPLTDWWSLAWASPSEVWFAAAETAGTQTAIYGLDLGSRQRTVYRAPGSITLHDISATGVLVSFDRGSRRTELVASGSASPEDRTWREESYPAAIAANHALLLNDSGDSGGPKGSVYFWPTDQSQALRIADGSGLALSPDARMALVASIESSPTISIVPTGAGQAQILNLGPMESVSGGGWVPDGRLVVQVSRPGAGREALLLEKDGSHPQALLPPGMTLPDGPGNLVSPDGRQIVAVQDSGQLMVCGIADRVCHPAPGVADDDRFAGWSTDEHSLFVCPSRPDHFQVDKVDLTSGRRSMWKVLKPLQPAVSGLRWVAAAPDGAVLYGYSRSASQLYLIKGLQ